MRVTDQELAARTRARQASERIVLLLQDPATFAKRYLDPRDDPKTFVRKIEALKREFRRDLRKGK